MSHCPPKYEQEMLQEEQQYEKEPPGNGQHGIQYGDKEDSYSEQEESSSLESEMEGEGNTGPPDTL